MNTATETTPHTSKGNGKHGDWFSAAASSATHGIDAESEEGGGWVLYKKILNNLPKFLENTSHKRLQEMER
jgi:hypothetical protein